MTFATDLTALQPRLYRFARSLTKNDDAAHDLVQDTFVRALTHQDKYTPGTNLAGWTTTILYRTFCKQRTSAHRTIELEERHHESTSHDATMVGVLLRDVHAAIKALPQQHREIIVRYTLGEERQDVARTLGIPEGTVSSRWTRAKNALQHYVDQGTPPQGDRQRIAKRGRPKLSAAQRRANDAASKRTYCIANRDRRNAHKRALRAQKKLQDRVG